MEGFTHKVNPLAAGTGALINYWTVWNMQQRQPQAEMEPYVLLLVRPDGVYAYYVAMKMLEPIRTAQGYELIEDSTVLKLPEVDFGAKTACQTAVNRLLSERENIYRAAMKGGSGGSVFGGGGGGGSGRKGVAGGRIAGGEPGTVPADGLNSRRTGGNTFTMNDITGGDNAVGTRSWERVENFQGRPRRPGRGSSTDQGPFDSTDDHWDEEETATRGSITTGTSKGTEAGTPNGTDTAGAETAATENPRNGKSLKNAGSGQRGSKNATGSSSNGNVFDSMSPGSGEPEPGMPIGERPGRKSKPSKSGGEPADEGQVADVDQDEDSDAGSEREGEPGGSSRSQSGKSSKGSKLSDRSSSASRFAHDPRNSTRAPRPGEKPAKPSDDLDKPLEPEMLSGRRWGYCDQGASIGFEREVRVDVFEDRLVLAEKHIIPVGEGESKSETLERFATALDLCSRQWGRPPQGFFWAPRLKFVVKPEGNGNYEQLNAMMTRAGLSTSHEFARDAKAVEFGRAVPATTKPAPKTATPTRTGGYQ